MRSRPAAEAAVSEVLGQVLTFAILGVLVTGALLAFGPLRERTEAGVARTEAEAAATRVAAAVVQAAVLAEHGSHAATGEASRTHVPLPRDLAGHAYRVTLEASAVRIDVPALGLHLRAPTFQAGGAATAACEHTVAGGPLAVVDAAAPGWLVRAEAASGDEAPAGCAGRRIHLEAAA
ncbi:MAG TPA: hypothetical protein VFH47_05545 [Candidatus Thermoplasmatota archaeon]|nr:hypothetical protein [Candidatus Thermoplasmatota archaeon]